MRLDRHARLQVVPGIAELAYHQPLVHFAAEGAVEPEARVEDVDRSGPPGMGEVGRLYAVLRGAADVQRLGHGAEVLPKARRGGGGYAEGDARLVFIEVEETRGDERSREAADGAARVKALAVVALADSVGKPALDLGRGEERLEQVGAGGTLPPADREPGRQDGNGRMRQQAVHAFRPGTQLGVVVVQDVAA